MAKTRVVFFGNEQLAQGIKAKTPIFDALLADEHYEICALVLPRAHVRKPFPITIQAQKHNIEIRQVQKGAELLPIIEELKPEVGVLAAFGKLVPESVINAIPAGILNIHPSLLPKYRGTTPIETALLNGDTETGVSIMRLAKEMDAGNVLAQASVKITAKTTKQSLYEELSALGAKLLLNVLPGALAKNAPETAQNDAEATFTSKLSKDLALLKPTEKAAKALLQPHTLLTKPLRSSIFFVPTVNISSLTVFSQKTPKKWTHAASLTAINTNHQNRATSARLLKIFANQCVLYAAARIPSFCSRISSCNSAKLSLISC